MSDPFYEACEKHSARRCVICEKERGRKQATKAMPPPIGSTGQMAPADSVRSRMASEMLDGPASTFGAVETTIPPANDDALSTLPAGVFSPDPPFEVQSTGIRDRGIPPANDYTTKVKDATTRYLLAYTRHQCALDEVIEAQEAVHIAKDAVQSSHAERELARNELFDLIASPGDSKAE